MSTLSRSRSESNIFVLIVLLAIGIVSVSTVWVLFSSSNLNGEIAIVRRCGLLCTQWDDDAHYILTFIAIACSFGCSCSCACGCSATETKRRLIAIARGQHRRELSLQRQRQDNMRGVGKSRLIDCNAFRVACSGMHSTQLISRTSRSMVAVNLILINIKKIPPLSNEWVWWWWQLISSQCVNGKSEFQRAFVPSLRIIPLLSSISREKCVLIANAI